MAFFILFTFRFSASYNLVCCLLFSCKIVICPLVANDCQPFSINLFHNGLVLREFLIPRLVIKSHVSVLLAAENGCFGTDGNQAITFCWLTSYFQKRKMCILCKFNFALIFLFFREFNLCAKVILLETFV